MYTCEFCKHYIEEEFTPGFKQRVDVDGYCQRLERCVNGDELICNRFENKENE